VLVRVDPVVLLRRAIAERRGAHAGALRRPAADKNEAIEAGAPDWNGDLLHADEVFVTGIGSSTTYPDYKPAPFIVASQAEGVDMVTVVTEGIFSYCSFKVKIDTDRFLGPEQANVRYRGEVVGHVTTAEYGSQMLSLGGVHHLTGGSKKEGRVTCELMQRWATSRRWSAPSTAAPRRDPGRQGAHRQRRGRAAHARGLRLGGHRHLRQAVLRAWPTRWWWSTTTSPACSPSTRPAAASTCALGHPMRAASRRRAATSRSRTRAPAGAAPTSPTRSRSSKAGKRASPGPGLRLLMTSTTGEHAPGTCSTRR
jgi:hypothetical protein